MKHLRYNNLTRLYSYVTFGCWVSTYSYIPHTRDELHDLHIWKVRQSRGLRNVKHDMSHSKTLHRAAMRRSYAPGSDHQKIMEEEDNHTKHTTLKVSSERYTLS